MQAWPARRLITPSAGAPRTGPGDRAAWQTWQSSYGPLLVQVETDAGLKGIGVGSGGRPASLIVEQHFQRLLLGDNPFDIERLWDTCYRASLPYGRKGLAIMALSGVDIALWDLLGKALQQPVYQLLGGRVRHRIPCYVYGVDVIRALEMGFRAVKVSLPCGPDAGQQGIEDNRRAVAHAREVGGADVEVMINCDMAWNAEYTIRMADIIAPYGVRWMEEPMPPGDLEGYATLAETSHAITIAAGAHEQTRWGFREWICRRLVDILRPDLSTCGGISEGGKIAVLAYAQYVSVALATGANQPWALHVIAATVNAIEAEYVWPQAGDECRPPLFRNLPLPVDGWISPPDAPGLGVELNDEGLQALIDV